MVWAKETVDPEDVPEAPIFIITKERFNCVQKGCFSSQEKEKYVLELLPTTRVATKILGLLL